MRAIDCQGYAGAFSAAAVLEGYDIVGKLEQPDAFGMKVWMANRDRLAPNLEVSFAGPAKDWPIMRDITLLFGNPPCSAFSNLMADPKYVERGTSGIEGRQNQCMWDLVEYGARLDADIICFESVKQAGTKGLPLMHALHDRLEELTGQQYHLTMVFLNALSVGGSQNRTRFFWCASKYGPISMPNTAESWPALSDVIGDLVDAYDGGVGPLNIYSDSRTKRTARLASLCDFGWEPGMYSSEAYDRAVAAGMEPWTVGRSDMIKSPFQARRWRWDEPAGVLTGGCFEELVHPLRSRGFTYAEIARLSGFPEWFDITPIIAMSTAGRPLFGKATPVQSAKYVLEGIRRHLEGDDAPVWPTEFGMRRWMVDVMGAWRRVSRARQLTVFDALAGDPDGLIAL